MNHMGLVILDNNFSSLSSFNKSLLYVLFRLFLLLIYNSQPYQSYWVHQCTCIATPIDNNCNTIEHNFILDISLVES